MKELLQRILPTVQKPARYTGGEYNEIIKDLADIRVRIAFCFPDTYEIGMSNVGMRILYGVMNQMDGVWCERVFAPWIDFEQVMRENNIPLYGFCRGMQSILHYFGNELINVKNHVAVRHTINGNIGIDYVNSYHNQACVKLKDNSKLEVLAQSEDGVIEAIKHKSLPIIATMWHPEREEIYSEKDIKRIRELFNN